MNIAITGTVGSGKSGVASILAAALGVDPVDTDILCRQQLQHGNEGWHALQKRWGEKFFNADGSLDRVSLREAVFTEPEVRESLEDILHPLIRKEVTFRQLEAREHGKHLLLEVPLLFEKGWNSDFEYIIAVYAPTELCITRTVMRDGVSRQQAESILALQLSAIEKAERADCVVDNSGIWAATVLQVSLLKHNLNTLGLV